LLLRFLFFLLIGYIIVSALRAYLMGRKTGSSRRRSAAAKTDQMVLDPQCQSYVPKGEAIYQGGNYFCSRECARLFLSR